MTVLNINGKRVTVDDGFKSLSPEDQDATVDEIARSLGGEMKAPIRQDIAEQPQPEQKGSILPISRDAGGNVSFDSDAGITGVIKRAVTLPGDVMAGDVDPLSDEGIGRAAEFAGVFTPVSPAAGTDKGIAALAGQQPRPGMDVAAAANRVGVDLPRAVASDSTAVQQGGKILTNVPIGGTPLRKASTTAIEQLGAAAGRVQQGFGSGNVANAGSAARQGITDYATKTLTSRVRDAYDGVDALVTQNVTTPLSSTAKVVTDIGARRTNAGLPESGAAGIVRKALENKDGLNYQGIKDLRTAVGEMLDKPDLTANGFSQAELRQIYGGLTDDLKNAVSRAGGEKAAKAFESANQLAAKTSREREALNKVLGRDISDERLFDRITAMAGSNSRADRVSLARVRNAVSPETWDEMASGVISRLGRDADGNFSPDRFVTGYGKLSPEGKSALFGGKKELAQSLDDIAAVSRRFKKLNEFANPSGTAQSAVGAGYLSGVFLDPATVVGSVVGARVLSNIMAKPVGAKALAAYAKAYERQATKPSKAASQAFINTSRAVAAIAAHEAGNKGLAATYMPRLGISRQQEANQTSATNARDIEQMTLSPDEI